MDIKEIKKLKGYQIAYNENYICYMGSRLVVHGRHGNEVCTFSDMRNYGWVDLFKGHYLVARNGGCTFKVYDLQQKNVCENLSGVWKTVFTLWAARFG